MSWKPSEIKSLRQALGLTQAQFAKKLSVSRRLVAYWERGEKSPTKDFQKKLEQLRKEMPTYLEHRFLSAPDEIKALRETLGLTQAALAKKLKISKRLVIYWETGKRSPSPFFQAKLKRLASDGCHRNKSENSEGEQNVNSSEGEQNVNSSEGEQNVNSSEGEQNVNSSEEEQIITSSEEDFVLNSSEGGQAENIAQVSCKEAALEYLSYGWSVLPLCPPDCSPDKVPWHWRDKDGKPCKCAHPGKVPLIAWTVYQERLPTALEVEQWFSKWPFANVGIVTGRVSKLLVVDFDSYEAINAIKKLGGFDTQATQPKGFEKTPEVKTGGSGQHNYFQHPSEGIIKNFAGKLKSVHPSLEKVDFRADGGQVVAPPSLHVSGNRYVWTVPPNEVKLPPLPKWFFDMLEQKPTEFGVRNSEFGIKKNKSAIRNPQSEIHSPPVVVKKASRLPDNFEVLKKCDSLIKSLWSNESLQVSKKGGPETSACALHADRSDYDWALGRACIERGIRNRDDLATILAHFPHGKYARDGSDYNLALTVEKLMQTIPHKNKEDAEKQVASKMM